MNNFPVLYKRTKNNSIQTWEIKVNGSEYYTVEGLKDCILTTSKPTLCLAKNDGRANSTTPEEQAQKEAEAKFKKQKEKGYTENIDDIDTSMKYFEPMLCKKYEDVDIDFDNGIFVQKKLDGMRCICKKDGMWSRNGKKIISAPHIFESLQPLFDKDPDLIFDGELYCDKYKDDFNSIMSLVKKTKPTQDDLQDSKNSIQYWIYDLPSCKSTFVNRNKTLVSLFYKFTNAHIVILDTYLVKSQKEMDDLYYSWLEEGAEGQIIRIANGLYENKRSKNVLKRKEFKDEEYEIVSVEEGIGNRSGTAGYMVLKMKDGRTFKSNIKGNYAYLTEILKHREELISRKATIKFFCLTPDGIPRFPFVINVDRFDT